MEATNPITERNVTVTRQHARRPQLRLPTPQSGQSAANEEVRPTSRSQVLDAFRDMAHGITAPIAEGQTRAFYRSGGQAWTRSLAEQGGDELKARVVEAFREMAHAVQDGSAHASMLRFYRSSGQSWSLRLA